MIEILPLDRRYNSAMLDILRQSPVKTGGLTLCFDRQPDIFTMADLKYNPAVWNGVFDDGKLMGFGLVGYHEAYVNGTVQRVMHLTDCYFDPQARNRGYLSSALPHFFRKRETSLGYAVVMHGNHAPKAILERKFAATRSEVTSRFFGKLTVHSALMFLPRRKRSSLAVRHARMEDIDEIVSLLHAEHEPRLFGYVVDRSAFIARLQERPGLSIENYFVVEGKGRLTGVCAAWDTSSFKQDRVLEYGFWLTMARPACSLASRMCGIADLPKPGEPFRNIFITDWAAQGRSVEIMRALLEYTYIEYRSRGHQSLVFGSCSDDPVLEALKGFQTDSLTFAVSLVVLDTKWLAEGALDDRLPFIDVALL
jgi:RimJ/RimL family protein N-acetyltransferase